MSHAATTILSDSGLEQLIAAITHRAFVDCLSLSSTLANDASVFLCDMFDWTPENALERSTDECKRLSGLGIIPDPAIHREALPEWMAEIVLTECRIDYQMILVV